MGVEGVNY